MEKPIEKILKAWIPMTETAFYILLALQNPRHGYGITKYVKELTDSRINLGSGTIYGTLTKLQRDDMIEVYDEREKKIIYIITETGRKVLEAECSRIAMLYRDSINELGRITAGEGDDV